MAVCVPAFAAERTNAFQSQELIEKRLTVDLNQSLSQSEKQFLQKYCKILSEFSLDENNVLALSLSDEELIKKYSFTNSDLIFLHKIIDSSKEINKNYNHSGSQIQPNVFIEGTVIYFTASDVDTLLLAAASAGPTAMIAALDLVATMTGGPVATAITTVLGVIGVASISNFCYLCIQAHTYGEGVYIGVEFDGGFPNGVQGRW
ncbi:hypothetical protein [Caproicibacter sp. BJN0012]